MKINTTMKLVFSAIGVGMAITMATVFQLDSLEQQVDRLSLIRYQSYQAADELRQSSDDLTRLGRTYVVTGDEKYEKMYMDILDIRNGKKPRPRATTPFIGILSCNTAKNLNRMGKPSRYSK